MTSARIFAKKICAARSKKTLRCPFADDNFEKYADIKGREKFSTLTIYGFIK